MAFGKSVLAVTLVLAVVSSAFAARCPKPGQRLILHGIGKNPEELRDTFDKFNMLLGGDDNGSNPGPLKEGRRSINWDAPIVPFDFPGDFFAKVVTRGLSVSNKDNKFAVSNPPPPTKDDKFSSINPKGAKDFQTFSPERLFTPLYENKVTIEFSIPAKKQKAYVKGFGAVYVDVDKKMLTKAVYYDKNGCVLASEYVDPLRNGLSFLGVLFDAPIIAKVELYLGGAPLKGYKPGDKVVLDDFLYSEPQAKFYYY